MKAKLEILALVLGFVGLAGAVATTLLPMWKVTAYIGANLIVMETLWEGLWMACIRQIDINMQCEAYHSMLSLPPDIQAARGLMCTSVILATFAVLVSLFGMRNTDGCHGNGRGHNVVLLVSGCLFVMAFLATLVPVCWSTHTIIRDFYNPVILQSLKREIGQALYLGFVTALVLLAAGVILLTRQRKDLEDGTFGPVEKDRVVMLERTPSSNSYRKSQYV